MKQIHDPLAQAAGLLTQMRPLVDAYLAHEGSTQMKVIEQKLGESRLQVMLLGAYNAGKSTVVNTLLGQVKARMGDIPTTDVVDCYEWGGHLLLDTPGVNAPVEHEEVSAEALMRADLVLFVIRQEDQDARDIINRLLDLVERERPVFVLLNHDCASADQVESLRAHLVSVLVREAAPRGISQQQLTSLHVLPLHGASALKARLENKRLLQAASGYDTFVERFNQWLVSYETAQQRVSLLCEAVERVLIEPLRARLVSCQEAGAEGGAFDRAHQTLKGIQQERALCLNSVSAQARLLVSGMRGRVGAALEATTDADTLRQTLEAIVGEAQERLSAWLLTQPGFEEKLRAYTAEQARVTSPELNGESGVTEHRVEQVALALGKKVDQKMLSAVLHMGRKLKLPWLKGRWSSTLDKWAGKAMPWLQAGLALLEVNSALRQEREENAAKAQAVMLRHQWKEEICSELLSTLEDMGRTLVSQVFSLELDAATKACDKLRAQASQQAQDLERLEAQAREWQCLAIG